MPIEEIDLQIDETPIPGQVKSFLAEAELRIDELFDTEKNLEQVANYINSDLTKFNSKKARQRIKRKLDVSFRIEKIKERIVKWK